MPSQSPSGPELSLGLKALHIMISSQQALMAPKMNSLVQVLMGVESGSAEEQVESLLQLIGESYQWRHLDVKNLVSISDSVSSLKRVCQLTKTLLSQIAEETFGLKHPAIFEALLSMLTPLLSHPLLSSSVVDVFLAFSLKCNEVQLRKHYSALKTLSDNSQEGQAFFLRVTLRLTQ